MNDLTFPSDWSDDEQLRWKTMAEKCAHWREEGKIVVFATGVFDLFHQEHKNFLRKARQAGDILIVGIETDSRVQVLKGKDRPINKQDERLQQVQNFSAVTEAILLPKEFSRPEHHKALIALIRPNILAVSSHSDHQDKKRAILEAFGGTLKVVHEHNPSVSTTQLLA